MLPTEPRTCCRIVSAVLAAARRRSSVMCWTRPGHAARSSCVRPVWPVLALVAGGTSVRIQVQACRLGKTRTVTPGARRWRSPPRRHGSCASGTPALAHHAAALGRADDLRAGVRRDDLRAGDVVEVRVPDQHEVRLRHVLRAQPDRRRARDAVHVGVEEEGSLADLQAEGRGAQPVEGGFHVRF